jgi:hypothetical protein
MLAAYNYPRHVWIADKLSRGPTGKIVKREIVPQATWACDKADIYVLSLIGDNG